MSAFAIVPYDRDKHGGFVATTFLQDLQGPRDPQWPWLLVPRDHLREALRRSLADPSAVALVAHERGDPDAFMGWAVCIPSRNEVVFAYTRHTYRRDYRVCTTLLERSGVDLLKPTPIRFWTRAAERIRLRDGYQQIYFRVTDPSEERRGRAAA